MIAKVKERLAVSKQAAQNLDGERFNTRKLNELEVGKQYQIEISNRSAAVENLTDGEDIIGFGRTLKSIQNFSKRQSRYVRIEAA